MGKGGGTLGSDYPGAQAHSTGLCCRTREPRMVTAARVMEKIVACAVREVTGGQSHRAL